MTGSPVYRVSTMAITSSSEFWLAGLNPGGMLRWSNGVWTAPAPGKPVANSAAVKSLPGGEAWAVGSGGSRRWNGVDWAGAPRTNAYSGGSNSLDFFNPNDGWTVAYGGEILHWNGAAWDLSADVEKILNAVEMISASDGWAGGESLYHYNGSDWFEVPGLPAELQITDIDMLTASSGWAVGDRILRWNGSIWSEVASPVPGNTIFGVDMLSATDGWAVVGGGQVLRWNGTAWQVFTTLSSTGLYAIDMVSPTDGWIIAGFTHWGEMWWGSGNVYHWNGSTWQELPRPANADVASLSMVSKSAGWAVGAGASPDLRYVEGPNLGFSGLYLPVVSGPPPTLSGRVTNGGTGVASVTVTVTGGKQVVTDAQGYYTLTLDPGAYTITPTRPGFTFSPATRTATLPPSAASQNFTTTCTEALVNGGFESSAGWELPVTTYTANYTTSVKRSGSRSMRVGITSSGEDVYSYSSAWQKITIPADAKRAKLNLWLYPLSRESGATNFPPRSVSRSPDPLKGLDRERMSMYSDVQWVMLRDTYNNLLETLVEQRSNAATWKSYGFDLSSYAGRTLWVYLGVYNDGWGGATGMYVDDVSMTICK
ncbi:MAG: carboxypeptidase regulatory-like domain-containing protein [Chloroflexi bacterium]|nr:MAG: carboxypeptidase regulatory-like domain-containing protein [Chloroflexota bacterium]